jgi:hypothetical protein
MTAAQESAGVQVAGGDPNALQGAADYHYQLADGLEYHAGAMDAAATALYGVWQGQAASSYQMLSAQVAAHFRGAAGAARTAAQALARYSAELRRCQQEGLQALRQAVYWLDQVRQWGARYEQAERAVKTATQDVQTAQTELNTANAQGAKGAAAASAAWARLVAAKGRLQRAQTDLGVAQEELRNAERELLGWQRRGRQLWEEAQHAAEHATGTLDATCVTPPPLASPVAASGVGARPVAVAQTIVGDLASAALAFSSSAGLTWAKQTGADFRVLRRYWLAQRERLATAADDPADPVAADQAVEDWAKASGETSRLSSRIQELAQLEDGMKWMGPAGGVIDAGIHIAEGESVQRAAAQGGGSAALGTIGAWGGGAVCAAIPGAEEAAPLCAGAGGAVLGTVGDWVGGAIDDLFG